MKFQHLERVRLTSPDPDKKVGTVLGYTPIEQVRVHWDGWSTICVYPEAALEHAV